MGEVALVTLQVLAVFSILGSLLSGIFAGVEEKWGYVVLSVTNMVWSILFLALTLPK